MLRVHRDDAQRSARLPVHYRTAKVDRVAAELALDQGMGPFDLDVAKWCVSQSLVGSAPAGRCTATLQLILKLTTKAQQATGLAHQGRAHLDRRGRGLGVDAAAMRHSWLLLYAC